MSVHHFGQNITKHFTIATSPSPVQIQYDCVHIWLSPCDSNPNPFSPRGSINVATRNIKKTVNCRCRKRSLTFRAWAFCKYIALRLPLPISTVHQLSVFRFVSKHCVPTAAYYVYFINVTCCVAVKWCGSMSVIAVWKFWKCTTLVANACFDWILKAKNKRVSIKVLDYQFTFRMSPICQLGF